MNYKSKTLLFKNNFGFTLVELIVVIAILAILWTIAFTSLAWYSKSARDVTRISDLNNIKKSFELYMLKSGKYPEPSNSEPITYDTSALAWDQWTVWEVTVRSIWKLSKIPVDPIFDTEYTYSVTENRKEYSLGWVFETNDLTFDSINNTYAASSDLISKVMWNFNWTLLKVKQWNITTILAMPTIIASEIATLEQLAASWNLVVDWEVNLPSNFKTGEIEDDNTWEKLKIVNVDNFVLFRWNSALLSDDSDEWKAARKTFVWNMQKSFVWTVMANVEWIKEIVDADLGNDDLVESLWMAVSNSTVKDKSIYWKLKRQASVSELANSWLTCTKEMHIENGLCRNNTRSVDCKQILAPSYSKYNVVKVNQVWNTSFKLRWEKIICDWSCKTGYTEISGICEETIEEVIIEEEVIVAVESDTDVWCTSSEYRNNSWDCIPNTQQRDCYMWPTNRVKETWVRTYVQEKYTLTYSNWYWRYPDWIAHNGSEYLCKRPICYTGYTLIGTSCFSRTNTVYCEQPETLPDALKYTIKTHTVNLVDWAYEAAPTCLKECNDGYHTWLWPDWEAGWCYNNDRKQNCTTDWIKPLWSDWNIVANWVWNWYSRNIPACTYTCNNWSNATDCSTKQVSCDSTGQTAPSHSSLSTSTTITYSSEWVWSTPWSCDVICNSWFHLEWSTCESNTKTVSCTEWTKPTNSSYISSDKIINWSWSSWSNAAQCSFECNSWWKWSQCNTIALDPYEFTYSDIDNSIPWYQFFKIPNHQQRVGKNVQLSVSFTVPSWPTSSNSYGVQVDVMSEEREIQFTIKKSQVWQTTVIKASTVNLSWWDWYLWPSRHVPYVENLKFTMKDVD